MAKRDWANFSSGGFGIFLTVSVKGLRLPDVASAFKGRQSAALFLWGDAFYLLHLRDMDCGNPGKAIGNRIEEDYRPGVVGAFGSGVRFQAFLCGVSLG